MRSILKIEITMSKRCSNAGCRRCMNVAEVMTVTVCLPLTVPLPLLGYCNLRSEASCSVLLTLAVGATDIDRGSWTFTSIARLDVRGMSFTGAQVRDYFSHGHSSRSVAHVRTGKVRVLV